MFNESVTNAAGMTHDSACHASAFNKGNDTCLKKNILISYSPVSYIILSVVLTGCLDFETNEYGAMAG